jgi:hypothetical protein
MEKRVCRVHLHASNVTPRRPWVYAVGTVGLDVNLGVFLGVLILFTEASHVRRRSDNRIHKLDIMMFTLHHVYIRPARNSRWILAEELQNCKMALIFEIEVAVVFWNSFFACGCAI